MASTLSPFLSPFFFALIVSALEIPLYLIFLTWRPKYNINECVCKHLGIEVNFLIKLIERIIKKILSWPFRSNLHNLVSHKKHLFILDVFLIRQTVSRQSLPQRQEISFWRKSLPKVDIPCLCIVSSMSNTRNSWREDIPISKSPWIRF